MLTQILPILLLFTTCVAGSDILSVQDEKNVQNIPKAVPDEVGIDAIGDGLSHRNLYKWRKHKYDDDDDDDCDCDDVIKAFENFFDCCVEEAHKRRLGSGSSTSSKSKSSSKSSKKPKHCGYDKDFSDDVNEAIKCCEFDDLVDAL